jgi:hypothetical protein
MFIVLYVSKDVEQADDMLKLWTEAGAPGVTILESYGLQQLKGIMDDVGVQPSLTKLMQSRERHHRTIFSAVKDQETVDRIVKVSTEFAGDWSRADVGVLLIWPLAQAFGLDKNFSDKDE